MHLLAFLGIHGALDHCGHAQVQWAARPIAQHAGLSPLLTHILHCAITLCSQKHKFKDKIAKNFSTEQQSIIYTKPWPLLRVGPWTHTHEAGWSQGLVRKLFLKRSEVTAYVYTHHFHNRVYGKLKYQRPVG